MNHAGRRRLVRDGTGTLGISEDIANAVPIKSTGPAPGFRTLHPFIKCFDARLRVARPDRPALTAIHVIHHVLLVLFKVPRFTSQNPDSYRDRLKRAMNPMPMVADAA